MKHPVLLAFGRIALMSIILSAGAQTMPESEDCLYFTKIDTVEITATWNRNCAIFKNSTSYKIELFGKKDCISLDYPCVTDECSITIGDMDCNNGYPILPCSPVTYNVTGNNAIDVPISRDTTAAPVITPSEWNLTVSNSHTDSLLHVLWGPPKENNQYATCATKAEVTAECIGFILPNITYVNPWNNPGTAVLDARNCENGFINVTVTYMSDDVLTETKSTTPYDYHGPASTTALPVDSTTNTAKTESSDSTTAGVTGDGLSGGVIAGIVIGSLLDTYITNRIQI